MVDVSEHLASLQREVKRLTPIPTVAGIIRTSRGEIIIGQRRHDQSHPGLWCFPGGKAEPTDSGLVQAVRREIMEELGIEVTTDLDAIVHRQIVQYDHGTFDLHYFNCSAADGQQAKALEFAAIAEVPEDCLRQFKMLAVDCDIAERLCAGATIKKLQDSDRLVAQYLKDALLAILPLRAALKLKGNQ